MNDLVWNIFRAIFIGGIIIDGIFLLTAKLWSLPFCLGILLLVILIALLETTTSILHDSEEFENID